MVSFFGSYSSMTIGFVGSKNGNPDNLNLTYDVVYHSSTTYKVSLDFLLNGQATQATLWVLNNGNFVALYASGSNHTGSAASNTVQGYFTDLETLSLFAVQESTITSYFHSTGTSTANIGSNSFPVTDYVANTTPETFPVCSGGTVTLNAYNVYLGTPTGSSLELVTHANFDGTLTTSTGTTTLDYTYEVTGLTVT